MCLLPGLWGKMSFVNLFVVSVCMCVRVFDYCLTSNTAEIKAQNKCCENKSPRAVTHDHAQDTDGVWMKKKKRKEHGKTASVAEQCVCLWDLPEVAVCVVVLGGVQVLCWEQACFFALLLLLGHAPGPGYTNTQLYVNSRHFSARTFMYSCKKLCLFLCPGFGFRERESSSQKAYGANKWTLSSKSTRQWCNIQSLILLVYTTLRVSTQQNKAVLCKWGQCLLSPRCLQRNRATQRLCRWLTWCAAVSWLKHFLNRYTLKFFSTKCLFNELLQTPKEERKKVNQVYNHKLCFQTFLPLGGDRPQVEQSMKHMLIWKHSTLWRNDSTVMDYVAQVTLRACWSCFAFSLKWMAANGFLWEGKQAMQSPSTMRPQKQWKNRWVI